MDDEASLPKIIIEIQEQDLGDDVVAMTIIGDYACLVKLIVYLGDQILMGAAGIDLTKINTGFPAKFKWNSRGKYVIKRSAYFTLHQMIQNQLSQRMWILMQTQKASTHKSPIW